MSIKEFDAVYLVDLCESVTGCSGPALRQDFN
jgi:hypothetical protein